MSFNDKTMYGNTGMKPQSEVVDILFNGNGVPELADCGRGTQCTEDSMDTMDTMDTGSKA